MRCDICVLCGVQGLSTFVIKILSQKNEFCVIKSLSEEMSEFEKPLVFLAFLDFSNYSHSPDGNEF